MTEMPIPTAPDVRTATNTAPEGRSTRETVRIPVTYSCGGCSNRWSGASRAHCSGCHETFGGAAFFDRHRRIRGEDGYCLHPSQIEKPEMFLVNGIWMSVENPKPTIGERRRKA